MILEELILNEKKVKKLNEIENNNYDTNVIFVDISGSMFNFNKKIQLIIDSIILFSLNDKEKVSIFGFHEGTFICLQEQEFVNILKQKGNILDFDFYGSTDGLYKAIINIAEEKLINNCFIITDNWMEIDSNLYNEIKKLKSQNTRIFFNII